MARISTVAHVDRSDGRIYVQDMETGEVYGSYPTIPPMMDYHVYGITPGGQTIHIAQTVYLEDAQAVLKNWHDGHILRHLGEMIIKKENGKEVVIT